MAWFTANWFWVLIFIALIAMHLFGHGGHGGHRDLQQSMDDSDKVETQDGASTCSGGHQH